MKDLKNKVVKVNSKEEAREVLRWLRANTKYDLWDSEEGFLDYYTKDSYIAIFNNRIFIPLEENFNLGTEIISKQEFMSIEESLQDKKDRLQRELEEIDKQITEESEIKVGDYATPLFRSARGSKQSLHGREPKIFYKVIESDIYGYRLANANGVPDNNGWMPIGEARKATPTEIASMSKEREYILKSDHKLKIRKDTVQESGYTYQIEHIKNLVDSVNIEYPTIGSVSYRVSIKDVIFHIGCSEGPDITLQELKEILSIAESLK